MQASRILFERCCVIILKSVNKMNTKRLFTVIILLVTASFIAEDAAAQFRRHPGRYYGRGPVVYHRRPAVSIGIGGVFGGYYPYRVWGPSVGVNVGIVLPPPGANTTIRRMPPGTQRRYYGGITYYYRNNNYYRERQNGGYEMVEPPLGATFDNLPGGTRKRIIDGEIYYERDGNYYMRDENADGDVVYILVGKDGELDTTEARRRMMESDRQWEEDEYTNDKNYRDNNNRESDDDEIIVRNGNKNYEENSNDAVYDNRPQLGDRLEQLPKDSRVIAVDGKKQYVSPSGNYYKEVQENGKTVYEVVRVK